MACSTDGRITSQFGEINELISPAQNYYNSLFVQLQRRMSHGLSLQASYTFAKSIMLDGMDFNNQFDFSNTHATSLLDQRHRLTLAAVYAAAAGKINRSGQRTHAAFRLDAEQRNGVFLRPSLRGC